MVPLEDGRARGQCEGFASAKDNYMRVALRLEWDAPEYYKNVGLFMVGIVNDAWARVRNNELFAIPANLTLANFDRFWDEIIFDLPGNQTDARGVAIKHLKRAVSHEDPYDNVGRIRDFHKMLRASPQIAAVPTEQELKSIYFGLYPKGWRERWKAVPRVVNSDEETLVNITQFMNTLYNVKQKSGKRISDGGTLKSSEAPTSSKGDKSGDKTTTKRSKGTKSDGNTAPKKDDGMCCRKGCRGAPPPHKWIGCWYN